MTTAVAAEPPSAKTPTAPAAPSAPDAPATPAPAPAVKKPTHNEELKTAIPTLAGNVMATMQDPAADRFADDDTQFLKFHGIYQQDDRDLRKAGKKYMFMIRGRIPGGSLTADGYLTYDRLATDYGNNTLRLTSRQSFPFGCGFTAPCLRSSSCQPDFGYDLPAFFAPVAFQLFTALPAESAGYL